MLKIIWHNLKSSQFWRAVLMCLETQSWKVDMAGISLSNDDELSRTVQDRRLRTSLRWWLGFVPGISQEIPDFSGKFLGNKKFTGFPRNFPGITGICQLFPFTGPGNEKSGKLQTLMVVNLVGQQLARNRGLKVFESFQEKYLNRQLY